ncbi:TetR/AcrR family transcriptional regulator [Levilactobacillus fujinensis]|uniref:TetR/AcrR family transcriptional regulator n=1 Tax=Levilactobacillus fujinensis TaxID=2486024 RepID=A0ABW1TDA0_9LACO|nr:TetR/AcrR family transcriptional regulator [Levilactobacillus fujinensis]
MSQLTRTKIIAVAEALITQTGDAAVTLDQISQELGITHAALYKHFQNKRDLWEAVSAAWFQRTIITKITVDTTLLPKEQLHAWLWAFVNAKKQAYNTNPQMFTLNTQYIDNNPEALRTVLTSAYQAIDELLDYHDTNYERAETILAAFSVFTLPNFKDTWNSSDYEHRFELVWKLIEPGLQSF